MEEEEVDEGGAAPSPWLYARGAGVGAEQTGRKRCGCTWPLRVDGPTPPGQLSGGGGRVAVGGKR